MNSHVKASAPYSRRPPSPPSIAIPAALTHKMRGGQAELVLEPAYENVDPESLSQEDLAIITGHQNRIVAFESATSWTYEKRREAQSILDFLYLGPNSVIRELEYLRSQGISMILVVRDSRLAGRPLQSLKNATAALGIEGLHVDVGNGQQLIRSFPDTVRSINNHLLSIYHKQSHPRTGNGQMMVDGAAFKRGKVLVTCQTGNDAAPVVVAAYLMAVLGKDMTSVIQFIAAQRFCCLFDENSKRLLKAWEDILQARAQVARSRSAGPEPVASAPRKLKRDFDVTMGEAEHDSLGADWDRFTEREPFVPFKDVDG